MIAGQRHMTVRHCLEHPGWWGGCGYQAHTHTLTLTLIHTHTHTLTLTLIHTHTHTHSLTFTHTHTLLTRECLPIKVCVWGQLRGLQGDQAWSRFSRRQTRSLSKAKSELGPTQNVLRTCVWRVHRLCTLLQGGCSCCCLGGCSRAVARCPDETTHLKFSKGQ